jgi:HSP20 family protein
MSIVRWNPGRGLATFPADIIDMQRDVNRIFDNFFRGGTLDDGSFGTSAWSPAVDIAEREDGYDVKVELPGVKKEDVKITMQENILTIRGEKKQEDRTKEANVHRVERSYGSFQRSFTLPTNVKPGAVDATFKDGILSITLPKEVEAKPRQIEVRVK